MLVDYSRYHVFSRIAEVSPLQPTTFLFVNFLTCVYCSTNYNIRQSILVNFIKTYSQQVSYACCTVCYAHFLCEAPPGLGYVDEEYILIKCLATHTT